jgi:aspartate/methionine/tyrosine aminotransferase
LRPARWISWKNAATPLPRRRNALLPALRQIGFRFATEPQGAFYLYADISGLADSSETLARRLIEEAGVATTPGLDFGDNAPERHLRIAYTTDEARLVEKPPSASAAFSAITDSPILRGQIHSTSAR